MGWFSDDHQDAYDAYDSAPPHQASLSHELIAGAAAFEAAKAYENHCEENGKPASHALAKEILAGFTGAAIDRVVETKGLDALDDYRRNQATQQVQQRLSNSLANQYDDQY
ncbi:hypothetical protein OG21DRAFT_1488838 [Imleria badia]|nr:hypothetical protein OG21DRAFT_1488838 [Imleria badia]